MTYDERLLWLAEQEMECPDPKCPEHRRPAFEDTRPVCATCKGTGRVVQFPSLRLQCPVHYERTGHHASDCQKCQGRGWVPVDTEGAVITAILAAEYLISEIGVDKGDNQIYVELEKLPMCYPIVEGKGVLINEALVAALYQMEGGPERDH